MTAVIDRPTTEYFLIALDELHPSPDNPRAGTGDEAALKELAASITEHGVVEPLIVAPAEAGGYVVIAGHRRLAAAALAKITGVPCVVRHGLDDRTHAALRVVENIQREDLSPMEETRAYQALVDLGLSQRALAKQVSRSQPHISRRLSLLKLPPAAIASLDTGGITVEQATTLARLPAENVAGLFKRGQPREFEIADAVRVQERAEALAASRKKLEAAGVTVLDEMPGAAWRHALRGPGAYGLGFTPDEHASEPCHAAVVCAQYGRAADADGSYVCTDPDRHDPDGASALKKPVEPAGDEDDDEEDGPLDGETDEVAAERIGAHQAALAARQERKGRRMEAIEARQLFVADIVGDIDADGAVELLSLLIGEVDLIEDPLDQRVMQMLGIEPDTYAGATAVDQVKRYMAAGSRNRARAMAATAAVTFENIATPNSWVIDQVDIELVDEVDVACTRVWFDYLVAHGYELSAHDRELVIVEAEIVEDDEAAPPAITVTKIGKRWKVECSACGVVAGANTTEAYATERGQTHMDLDHALVEAETEEASA
jgi:ParB/RepB/Spo0J family partition protein